MESTVLTCFRPTDLKRAFFGRQSGISTFDKLSGATELVLAHITSSTRLPSIVRHGLLPHRNSGRRISDDLPSDPDYVYLSAVLDKFYFERAMKHHGGEGIVVVVEVPRTMLEADEAALVPDQRTLPPERRLYSSLCLGYCKHRGPILPDRFRGIYTSDGEPV